jgi:hypothetical protein
MRILYTQSPIMFPLTHLISCYEREISHFIQLSPQTSSLWCSTHSPSSWARERPTCNILAWRSLSAWSMSLGRHVIVGLYIFHPSNLDHELSTKGWCVWSFPRLNVGMYTGKYFSAGSTTWARNANNTSRRQSTSQPMLNQMVDLSGFTSSPELFQKSFNICTNTLISLYAASPNNTRSSAYIMLALAPLMQPPPPLAFLVLEPGWCFLIGIPWLLWPGTVTRGILAATLLLVWRNRLSCNSLAP